MFTIAEYSDTIYGSERTAASFSGDGKEKEMKSLYDIAFNKMKYSSVRLLAAIFLLGLTVFVIFDSVTNFTANSLPGKYVSVGSFVILTVVIIFAAIAVEKYPQFEKDSEMSGKAIGWYAAGALIAFILEMIIIFGFNSGFDVSRVVKPIMCIAITVYEFYMYFRARRLHPDDRGREEI